MWRKWYNYVEGNLGYFYVHCRQRGKGYTAVYNEFHSLSIHIRVRGSSQLVRRHVRDIWGKSLNHQ